MFKNEWSRKCQEYNEFVQTTLPDIVPDPEWLINFGDKNSFKVRRHLEFLSAFSFSSLCFHISKQSTTRFEIQWKIWLERTFVVASIVEIWKFQCFVSLSYSIKLENHHEFSTWFESITATSTFHESIWICNVWFSATLCRYFHTRVESFFHNFILFVLIPYSCRYPRSHENAGDSWSQTCLPNQSNCRRQREANEQGCRQA